MIDLFSDVIMLLMSDIIVRFCQNRSVYTLPYLPKCSRNNFKNIGLDMSVLKRITGSSEKNTHTMCSPVSSVPGRSTLRSAARGLLVVTFMRSATAQSRGFALVAPSSWSDLPQQLRLELLLTLPLPPFWKRLKPMLFASESTELGRDPFESLSGAI